MQISYRLTTIIYIHLGNQQLIAMAPYGVLNVKDGH